MSGRCVNGDDGGGGGWDPGPVACTSVCGRRVVRLDVYETKSTRIKIVCAPRTHITAFPIFIEPVSAIRSLFQSTSFVRLL